jgi:hypothetical protein
VLVAAECEALDRADDVCSPPEDSPETALPVVAELPYEVELLA